LGIRNAKPFETGNTNDGEVGGIRKGGRRWQQFSSKRFRVWKVGKAEKLERRETSSHVAAVKMLLWRRLSASPNVFLSEEKK